MVQHVSVDLPDGARIAVEMEGRGAPLLLVSGLGGTVAFWERSRALLAQTHRVITLDQRGIGRSTRGSAAVTMERLAEDVGAVAGALDLGRFALAGHSTGAGIALTLAAGGRVPLSHLLLSGGWIRADAYIRALFELRLEVLNRAGLAAYERLGRFLAYPPARLVESGDFGPSMTPLGPEEAERQALWTERIGALLAFDGTPLLDRIGLPVLVMGRPMMPSSRTTIRPDPAGPAHRPAHDAMPSPPPARARDRSSTAEHQPGNHDPIPARPTWG